MKSPKTFMIQLMCKVETRRWYQGPKLGDCFLMFANVNM